MREGGEITGEKLSWAKIADRLGVSESTVL